MKPWIGINLSICNFFCFKVCILIIFGTWFSSLLLYGIIVAPSGGGGFHFNINGLMVCEPYFLSNRILILSAYLFYFPTTMVLMYCYGTVFHSTKAKLRYKQVLFSTFPCAVTGTNTAKRVTKVIMVSNIYQFLPSSTAETLYFYAHKFFWHFTSLRRNEDIKSLHHIFMQRVLYMMIGYIKIILHVSFNCKTSQIMNTEKTFVVYMEARNEQIL